MDDMLSFLQEKGIINIDDVRDMMEQERRKSIISKHKYSIFQDKKDGRWKTVVDDPTKKNGKKLVAKKYRRDLEDYIIDLIDEEPRNSSTLRELYTPWLQSRILETRSSGTVKRNALDWKRYYSEDPIVDIPIKYLTCQQLKDWAHKKIRDNDFTKKQYYNMIVIMNKLWEYAKDCGIIETNKWCEVKVNKKLLKRDVKKSNETQIYFLEEKIKVVSYALSRFTNNHRDITALAIPLMFLTGMRIGEIVALKYEDFCGDEILVRRSEIAKYDIYEDGEYRYLGQIVEEHTKTDAGERSIPYTQGAKQIIGYIKTASEEYGFYDDGYVFCPNSKRIKSNAINQRIYDFCDKLKIPKKSAHKIRKTFISQMIVTGIDLDTVCRVSGHADISTTFNSYTYSLVKKEDRAEVFSGMCSDLDNVINV